MSLPRWRRRRSKEQTSTTEATVRKPDLAADFKPERGPAVLIELVEPRDSHGDDILAALGKRYEVSSLGGDDRRFRVVIDNAVFPDEAVVRLASVLDEIDQDWVQQIRWPKVEASPNAA